MSYISTQAKLNTQTKRFGYKKIVYVSIDPSVLENQQVDTAEQLLLTRAENQFTKES